jgi:GrpB protein
LRAALGAMALGIDHIGSTAVAGLPAKPVIDVQISVAAFEPMEAFKDPLEQLGYVYRGQPRAHQADFREVPGSSRRQVRGGSREDSALRIGGCGALLPFPAGVCWPSAAAYPVWLAVARVRAGGRGRLSWWGGAAGAAAAAGPGRISPRNPGE